MTPKTYSLKKDGDLLLSPHFRVREWASKCGSDTILIHPETARMVQCVRDHFARPVRITSGYRSPEHNRRVGGAPQSYHLRGMAADIVVAGTTPMAVYRAIDSGSVPGIDPAKVGLGLYTRQGFVHIDCRGSKARWGE
jgi:uncharacterized protein YcbK (DUF882 family)